MTSNTFPPNNYKYPKILLTGSTGQLGSELLPLLKFLGDVWAPKKEAFDLSIPESLRQKIRDYGPDIIINTAAFTDVDRAISEENCARRVNALSPKVMAEEAFRLGIPLIHFSTDFVFDGNKQQPYGEDDDPNPINIYGKTKLEGEVAIHESHNKYLILRTSWLYSPTHGKNFYTTMLRLFKEKEEVYVVNNQIGCPTAVNFLAEATVEILSQLDKKNNEENRWGIYHLAGEDKMSWYDFAKIIYKKEGKENSLRTKKILSISYKEYVTEALRPNYSVLNCDYVQLKFKDIYKKDFFDKSKSGRTTKPVYFLYFLLLKLLTPLFILVIPSFMSWFFDFGRKNRRLPRRKDRIRMELNILDEFTFFNYDSLAFDEVNICMRGNMVNIGNPDLPTFFVNPYKEIHTKFTDKYYVTNDRLIFKAMIGLPDNDFFKRFIRKTDDKTMYVLPHGLWLKDNNLEDFSKNNQSFKITELIEDYKKVIGSDRDYFVTACIHKYKGHNIQIGSGITSVLSMLHLSKKVNVYGWDAFLDGDMPNNFTGQTMKLWSDFNDFHPGSRFSAILLNWIYAYRLINEFSTDRLTVHGKVNEITKISWIKKYLFKVIYK